MLKVVLSSFAMIFLAELGDKTQLAVFSLAIESRYPWAVLLGAGVALVLSSLLAVLLASVVGKSIPDAWTRAVRIGAGGLFILVGLWTILKA